MKSSILQVEYSEDGKMCYIVDRIIITKDVICYHDLDQTNRRDFTTKELLQCFIFWLTYNDHSEGSRRFKYQEKIFSSSLKVIDKLLEWPHDSLIQIDEAW